MRPRLPFAGGPGPVWFVEENDHEMDERHEKEQIAEDAKCAELIKIGGESDR